MRILVINGPNLNMLGVREPGIYGTTSYDELVSKLMAYGVENQVEVVCFQSNHEGAIIDRLQQAFADQTDGVIINPGAYTHYSYAIYDALRLLTCPKVEVHISDIHGREAFRSKSVTSPACDKQIVGLGLEGYFVAVDSILASKKGTLL